MDKNRAAQELYVWEREAKSERLAQESEELLPACESVLWTTFFSQNRTRVMHAVTKAVTLLALCLPPLLLTACDNTPKKRTVCVTGLNEFERPMYRFWLDSDNKSGCFGNPSGRDGSSAYGGGGGFACGCSVRAGDRVKLEWEFEQTWEEYSAGEEYITGETMVTVPEPESPSSRYLFIYFREDGTNPMFWLDTLGVPELPPSKIVD